MIDCSLLIKNTSAYRLVLGDKNKQRLSHAYMIVCPDGDYLSEYLKIFARLLICKESEPCGECRECNLIDKKAHPDVLFYPKKDNAILTEDVNNLIEETFLKPIESDRKVFVIENAQTMNVSAQNKLLKTLEEPPKNVHIILGTTSEFPLLPTIKSRVRKVEIPAFSAHVLMQALKEDCPDEERLSSAIACADGTVGKTLALYGDETFEKAKELCLDVLVNMKSSKDVLLYSNKISTSGVPVERFLSVFELFLRDLLALEQGRADLVLNKQTLDKIQKAFRFNTGATIYALESVTEAYKRLKFNANTTMLIEWLLFSVLEGKFKWQKL